MKPIFLMVLATFFVSAGQILWKKGVVSFLSPYFIIGLSLYAIGGLLIIVAFRHGKLSILYPILATSYVWVSLLSPYFLGDLMNNWKWAGVLIILASVSLLGGSNGK